MPFESARIRAGGLESQNAYAAAEHYDTDRAADYPVRPWAGSPGHEQTSDDDADICQHVVGGEDVACPHMDCAVAMRGNQVQAVDIRD